MPTGPRCCSASRTAGTGLRSAALARLWERSKSPSAVRKTTSRRAPRSRRDSAELSDIRRGNNQEQLAQAGPDLRGVRLERLARRVLHRPGQVHAVVLIARHEMDMKVEHRLARGGSVCLVDREPLRREGIPHGARYLRHCAKYRGGLG